MGNTRYITKHFRWFLGTLAAISTAIVVMSEGNVVVELGWCGTGEDGCILLGSLALIVGMSISAYVVILSLCWVADGVVTGYKNAIRTIWWWAIPKPKVEHEFIFKGDNHLELYIHNQKRAYRIEYWLDDLYDVKGQEYKYSHELIVANPSQATEKKSPIYSKVMNENDEWKIDIGIDHFGKLALLFSDAYFTSFRDGKYKIVYNGVAYTANEEGITIMNERFDLPDIKTWIIIKDQCLVEV